MKDLLLELKGVSKFFGPTVALKNIDFTLRRGEIHGLIGENGSGKSTLTSIIAGIQPPDSGEMFLRGARYAPKNAIDGQTQKVAMIIQESGTAPGITVAENIFLGRENEFEKFGLISRKAMNRAAQKALQAIGADYINPSTATYRLGIEDRKLVEIAKARLIDNLDVLIVDETPTALSTKGREILCRIIEEMRRANKCVIFITHDLDELVSICTDVTVLRDGVIIGSLKKEEFDLNRIKQMMVGRDLSGSYYREDYNGSFGEKVVLRMENVSGIHRIENINLELHEGEILGIGGLTSSGMHELGRVAFGLMKPLLGKVTLEDGRIVSDPTVAVDSGLGYVSKDRDSEALMLNTSLRNNISLASIKDIVKRFLVSYSKELEIAQREITNLEIKCRDAHQPVWQLSGGNKQKVVFGRWVGNDSRILILDCPTRGVDVGVKKAMYDLIYAWKKKGHSIMLISEELPELIGMSDRILVLKDGKLSGEYRRSKDLTEHQIIDAMI